MGVLWSKIFRDLWGNKGRTLQVVLIIGIGAAAVGMIISTRNLVIPGMVDIWTRGNPAMINFGVNPPLTEQEMEALKRVEGVATIEGFSSTTLEWKLKKEDEWKQGGLTARADYEDQKLTQLELVSGPWPHEKVMSVEQGSEGFFKIPQGGKVYIKVNDREELVQIGGEVYNPLSQPAYFGGTAQFYADPLYYERLVGDKEFSQLRVSAAEWDEPAVTELANRLQEKMEQQDKSVFRQITDPNKHFFQDQMDGLFYMLGVMAILSLLLGLLLVYNTINSIISRQTDQVGVMKAVGARTGKILRLFLTTVFFYGLMALLLALPLGIWGGWSIASWLITSFGADIGGFDISETAVIAMVLICLLAPMVASVIPVMRGARITVREAITTYGLSTKPGLIERLGARMKRVSRLFLLTISNTFRNKGRIILTEIVLVLSGLIFMMVMSIRDSAVYTVNDTMFEILDGDITLVFDQPERIEHIEQLALMHPEVSQVESWEFAGATIRPADQPETDDDESIQLFGIPIPTIMYGYQLRGGRWLDPNDSYAIVMNTKLAEEVGVGVGDRVTIKYSEFNQHDFQVVGLVFDPIFTTSADVPRDILLEDLNHPGRVGSIWINTHNQDPDAQIEIAKALRAYFDQNNVKMSPIRGIFGGFGGEATVQVARAIINQFNFIVVLAGIMALVIAIVGSIALSGTISLSVMERTREIGVMRAIGANNWTVARLFMGEALILGWLSWLIALPFSQPAGRVMMTSLSAAFQQEYIYHYTPVGTLMWLAIITVLSILASWLPARSATRISVRESLVYQ